MMYIWLIPVALLLVAAVAILYKTATKERPDQPGGKDRADVIHPGSKESTTHE